VISASQFGAEAGANKGCVQICQLLRLCEEDGIHVRGTSDFPVHRESEGANDGMVHFLALQDLSDIQEQERRLTGLGGPHGF
jgi:hypothetical protein